MKEAECCKTWGMVRPREQRLCEGPLHLACALCSTCRTTAMQRVRGTECFYLATVI